ncbi:FAD-dependent oxidoreductase [Salipiger sp. HF18]|uniref:NAD(P)/FAD-dependent oxidoreductase n=1 Tax=Salipiger sp. HF18 TaxID=2721557 RepID=UPI00142E0B07|nr:FAD-dependent oxidoreductase [Salipiger sp. HF18]NIY94786.1 FAD-dependent oxidoreductase [Salipiger sp. HF18]
MARIAVIGAGIIGSSITAVLQREGHAVTCFDPRGPGQAASFGNGGSIAPGSIAGTSGPGILGDAIRWSLAGDGPLRLHWPRLPVAAPWLRRFARAGRPDGLQGTAAALHQLHRSALTDYAQLLGPGRADLLRTSGQLYVYDSDKAYEKDAPGRALRRDHGVRMTELTADEALEMEPSLRPGLARALHLPDFGQTPNPGALVRAIAEDAVRDGARLVTTCIHKLLPVPGGRGMGLLSDHGEEVFDTVVVAAGIWSNRLLKPLGAAVPLESLRGYHATLELPRMPGQPIYPIAEKIMATPMEDGLRVVGVVEVAGTRKPPEFSNIDRLTGAARRIFRDVGEARSVWMGHRPAMPDSVPVICRAPGHPDLVLALGHGQTGMCGAPGTANLVSDLLAGRQGRIEPHHFDIARFR